MPLDVSVPAAARRYNVWLGGKDNFAADRDSAAEIEQAFPPITSAARANRNCLERVVRYLAAERGIRQFLDLGCAMPASPNVHEIAQEITPSARVLYVDNDKLVDRHARALLTSCPEGRSDFQFGDLRAPQPILAAARERFDLTRPVAVSLFAVLHLLPDTEQALDAVRELVAPLPRGSCLALSHATFDPLPEHKRVELEKFSQPDSSHGPFQPRTRAQVASFFDGLDLIDPGVVSTVLWRPNLPATEADAISEAEAICYAAAAVKP